MLYETLLQGKLMLCFLYFGILCGIILSIKKLFDKSFKKNKIVIIITDIIIMVFATLIFLYAKIKYCYGEFRVYMPLAFCLGIYLQQISINNLVEKLLKMFYNLIVKIFCKIKQCFTTFAIFNSLFLILNSILVFT